jgi:hypothetical protein
MIRVYSGVFPGKGSCGGATRETIPNNPHFMDSVRVLGDATAGVPSTRLFLCQGRVPRGNHLHDAWVLCCLVNRNVPADLPAPRAADESSDRAFSPDVAIIAFAKSFVRNGAAAKPVGIAIACRASGSLP